MHRFTLTVYAGSKELGLGSISKVECWPTADRMRPPMAADLQQAPFAVTMQP